MKTPIKLTVIFLATAMGILSAPDAKAGGAWARQAGGFYAKASAITMQTGTFYNFSGARSEDSVLFLSQQVLLYGEVGITERLTAVAQFPALKRLAFSLTEDKVGIGDLALDFKYQVLDGQFPVAFSLGAEFPTGDEFGFAYLQGSRTQYLRFPTGDGEFNVWTKAFVSHSLYPVPAYLSADIGYNFRTKGFTHQMQFGIEGGYKALDRVWLKAGLRGLMPTGSPNETLNDSFLFGEGVRYLSYSFGAEMEVVPHLIASLSVDSAFKPLQNIYAGTVFGFGIAVEY